MSESPDSVYEFGPFRLDANERRLVREGEVVSLPPKIFDTLVVLVRNQGHLITKEELLHEVWPESFVEEGNITVNISALRKALGERENGNRYIETVPKRGYRFVMPVRELSVDQELLIARRASAHITIREEETETGVLTDAATQGLKLVKQLSASRAVRIASVLIVLIVAITAGTIYWRHASNTTAGFTLGYAPGKVASAFNFSHESDFIRVSNSSNLRLASSFTFEAWVNPQKPSFYSCIISTGTDRTNRIDFCRFSNGALCEYFESDEVLCSSPGVLPASEFSHVAFTLDAVNHVAKLYANGVVVMTNNNARALKSPPEELCIGDSCAFPGNHFGGLIDEVSIYNRALSDTEVQAIFNAGAAGKCKHGSDGNCVPPPAGLLAWFTGDANATDTVNGVNGVAVLRAMDERERVRKAFEMVDYLGRGEDAVPILKDILKSDPNNALAHWALSEAYRYGGMLDESIAEGEAALRLDPRVNETPTLNTYYYAGQYQKFIDSIANQPDDPRTLFYRGLGFLYLKDDKRAVAAFDRAREISPGDFFARLGQAFKDSIKGDRADGLVICRQLEHESISPDGELFYKVAQAYALLGDCESAMRVLRFSIEHGFFCYPFMVEDPLLRNLRDQPEYVRVIGLAANHHATFKGMFF